MGIFPQEFTFEIQIRIPLITTHSSNAKLPQNHNDYNLYTCFLPIQYHKSLKKDNQFVCLLPYNQHICLEVTSDYLINM